MHTLKRRRPRGRVGSSQCAVGDEPRDKRELLPGAGGTQSRMSRMKSCEHSGVRGHQEHVLTCSWVGKLEALKQTEPFDVLVFSLMSKYDVLLSPIWGSQSFTWTQWHTRSCLTDVTRKRDRRPSGLEARLRDGDNAPSMH